MQGLMATRGHGPRTTRKRKSEKNLKLLVAQSQTPVYFEMRMTEQVHPDIIEALNHKILPHVFRIHDMDTPCPAQLWVNGKCEHSNGVAMFNIGDRGFLTAEYFGYDKAEMPLMTAKPNPGLDHLVMKDAKVEIPIWHVRPGNKARTRYSGVAMTRIQAYELDIRGWIGGSKDTNMPLASITLTGLPALRLPRSTQAVADEEHDSFTMRGLASRNAVMTLEAEDWDIKLTESRSNQGSTAAIVYMPICPKGTGRCSL